MDLKVRGINHLIPVLYKKIIENGKECSPRNMRTKELTCFSFELENPRDRILLSKVRGINYSFMAAEFLWIATNRNDVKMISFYNKIISSFSDDGETFNGAYGKRLSSPIDQFKEIVQILKDDKDSRKAVATIFNSNDLVHSSKDIPCTVMLNFQIRDNKLDLIVYMRSNDAWLGLPYDVFNFTCIQELIMLRLRVRHKDLKLGSYRHIAGSMHLYEPQLDNALKVSNEIFLPGSTPEMQRDCLDFVRIKEEEIRLKAVDKHDIQSDVSHESLAQFDEFWSMIILMLASRSREKCLDDLKEFSPFNLLHLREP